MSSIEATPMTDTSATAVPSRAQAAWDRIEAWLVRIGDRLNPILVKETRQAIKSRQFTVTFVLVLLACWIVTIGGVAKIGPGIFYSASGPEMFWYYYWVLAFPLAVIVPYSAYRSLAAEREDNTYELLSISNLTPRQIIAGKLASALVQMLVFLSAIAPCLAFTYLLRGIDVLTIGVLLGYTILGSLGLCVIGLFFATSSKERYGQIVMSVALVVGEVGAFIGAISLAMWFIEDSYQFVSDEAFWVSNAAMLTGYVTTFALVFLAAAAQITFTSDNRSTPLRIAMVVQQACFIGWVAVFYRFLAAYSPQMGAPPPAAIVLALIIPSGIYWYFMGALLTAEWPHLSARVKRSLPQSMLGRAILTWFNPGPGTGFMFAVANLATIALGSVAILALLPSSAAPRGGPSEYEALCFVLIGMGYIVAFLGVGKLLIDALRRVAAVPMVASVLINGFLLAAGCGVPLVIHMMSDLRYGGYTLMHVTNPIWTLEQVLSGSIYQDMLVFLVPAVGLAVFVANLPAVIREVRQVRVALPQRIVEDEALLHPPAEPKRESPWDDPETVPG